MQKLPPFLLILGSIIGIICSFISWADCGYWGNSTIAENPATMLIIGVHFTNIFVGTFLLVGTQIGNKTIKRIAILTFLVIIYIVVVLIGDAFLCDLNLVGFIALGASILSQVALYKIEK